jgi:hypothetical protein
LAAVVSSFSRQRKAKREPYANESVKSESPDPVKGDLMEVRKRYVSEFAKILPMLKVARFYQLENKLAADVEAELALLVPLVEDH